MTTTSGGNLSIRGPQNEIWITPARVDKGALNREDIVRVDLDGRVEGRHRPSSELPFHQAIYQCSQELHGIVHAHPIALVAFSIAGSVPNTRLFHKVFDICGDAGFAPYALPGSTELGSRIASCFSQGFRCVILENHGVVVAGESLTQAFQRFETLEFTAKTEIMSRRLGTPRTLSEDQLVMASEAPRVPVSHEVPETTMLERELRRQLVHFVRRGYQQRLFISTEGSFSARLGEDDFLITPYRAERSRITIEDFVRVHRGVALSHRAPSRASNLHRSIYQAHADVSSVANGYPVHASAFSITDAVLDSQTIPESYLFLREISRHRFGLQFSSPEAIAGSLGPANPVGILENDGVVVVGSSVLDAFDRLEVLESTAEAILYGSLLGPIRRMPDAIIAELRSAFS